ncbi:MAG: DUF928 domain-containing protein, partial [Cyanobacteria bacterium J06636_28]
MKRLKRIFSLTIVTSIVWTCLAPAHSSAQLIEINTTTIQFTPPTLDDRGRPYSGRRQGAASRGSCQLPEAQTGLTALVPNTQVTLDTAPEASDNIYLSNYESVLSLTTEAFPSFWFYVPYPSEDIKELEFVLQDERGNEVYQQTFTYHHDNPGVIEVALPNTISPLRLDTTYEWFFLAHCESGATALSPEVGGWIQRVELASDLQAQLSSATPLEMASIYAANGIWQNAITILGELYRTAPE